MENWYIIKEYCDRTGQDMKDIFEGLNHFGEEAFIELVEESNRTKKKIIFYYENEKNRKDDILSYKFEK